MSPESQIEDSGTEASTDDGNLDAKDNGFHDAENDVDQEMDDDNGVERILSGKLSESSGYAGSDLYDYKVWFCVLLCFILLIFLIIGVWWFYYYYCESLMWVWYWCARDDMKWWHTKRDAPVDILNIVIDQYKYEWLEWKCCQFSLLPSSI